MPGLLPDVDPEGLLEYSVVYTDRALNHMSRRFQGVMRGISATLKQVYGAHSAIVVPGSGSFGMEAVARQFATGKRCLVLRNGLFSYRWSQILDMGRIAAGHSVLKARRVSGGSQAQAPFAPAPIEEVVAAIERERPELVFAPHVETSAGMILPVPYLRAVGDAVHAAGGLFVLDCIASGAHWVDMREAGVDVLLSAPQKVWSSEPCCGLVMLAESARRRIDDTTSSSFSCDLRKWLQIMEAYEAGGHAYHATMPTDALARLHAAMREAEGVGFEVLCQRQQQLGDQVRALLERRGYASVAALGFQADGVVVSYTTDPALQSGRALMEQGVQIAAGVPLQCDEGPDFSTFRIGLFGLDKLRDVDAAAARLDTALARLPQPTV